MFVAILHLIERGVLNFNSSAKSVLKDEFFDIDKVSMEEEAGKVYRYNNLDYVILAIIIEKIAGISFDEYIQKEIVNKAGFAKTGYY